MRTGRRSFPEFDVGCERVVAKSVKSNRDQIEPIKYSRQCRLLSDIFFKSRKSNDPENLAKGRENDESSLFGKLALTGLRSKAGTVDLSRLTS
jgi:hypothetical protein